MSSFEYSLSLLDLTSLSPNPFIKPHRIQNFTSQEETKKGQKGRLEGLISQDYDPERES